MRLHRTNLTTVEAVEGLGFCGGRRVGGDGGRTCLRLTKKAM